MQYSIVDAASVKLHFILIILDLQITIRDNLTCMQENKRAGPSVIQHCRKTLHSRTKETGSQRGGPWSPRALKFLLWSPEPYHFTDWSPDPFLAVEPGAQRHFARSLEPSIFKFDHSSSQITLILDYCLFVFVRAC